MAEVIEFELNSSLSSVDLTAFGYVDNPFYYTGPSTTRDTQMMSLGGTITLDVDVADDAVQSVDFVSLEFNYLVDLNNPTIHRRITLRNSAEGVPKGSEIEVRLPFDPAVAAGNPVPRFAPTLTLNGNSGGAETGVGGDLGLTNPAFQFVGSGQYFDLPTDPDETPFVDGWPMDYGPYPTATPFPSMIPGSEYIPGDPPNTTMSLAPEGANFLDGTVSLVSGGLAFNGALQSMGVGGAGILQTAQIHDAVIVASTELIQPGDFDADGNVNGADFLLWQRMPAVGELADWRSEFGNDNGLASGSGTDLSVAATGTQQVPEPATLSSLLLVATSLVIGRRDSSQRC